MSTTHNPALLYHAHHNRHLEDLPFWTKMAEQFGDPILELGCGTGRVLAPLQKAGHQVFGLDNDFNMLSYLRDYHSREANSKFQLFQGDLTQFHLASRFNLIILPCNTYSTFSTIKRRSALACIFEHLMPKGAFVFSIPNPELFYELPRESEPEIEETFSHPSTGEKIQVSNAWMQFTDEIIFFWYYDIMSSNGQIDRVTLQIQHSITPAQDYLAEIKSAGLQVAMTWGYFDGSPYTSDSPYLIVNAIL